MAEDLLKAEDIAPVDKIAAGKRVAERVRRAARADPRAAPKPGDGLLGASLAQRTLPAREERVRHGSASSGAEIANERPLCRRSDRHDPFLGALAHDVERAVWADVADPERHELGQAESGVEEEQDQGRSRPSASASRLRSSAVKSQDVV